MAVKIRSLVTSGPIVVPLSSGSSMRLSPGQISQELPDVEVVDNAKVDKLRRLGVIDVESTSGKSGSDPDDVEQPVAEEGEAEPRSRPRKRSR
jgi:hypothetical protein